MSSSKDILNEFRELRKSIQATSIVPQYESMLLEAFTWIPGNIMGIILSRKTGEVVLVNKNWTREMGWENEDMLGKPLFSFLHPGDKESTIKAFSHFAQSRDMKMNNLYVNRYRRKDGGHSWVKWFPNNARDNGRYMVAYCEFIANDTEIP